MPTMKAIPATTSAAVTVPTRAPRPAASREPEAIRNATPMWARPSEPNTTAGTGAWRTIAAAAATTRNRPTAEAAAGTRRLITGENPFWLEDRVRVQRPVADPVEGRRRRVNGGWTSA